MAADAGANEGGAYDSGANDDAPAAAALDGSRPEVSVLIVGYRTREEVTACLRSLYEHAGDVDFEVVVVDNASDDGTVDAVSESFPQVHLVPLDVNVGFARGVNVAADHARGRYLLLLNPDTIVRPGAIAAIVAFARRHPEAGVVGGRTVTEDGDVEPSSCWGKPTMWSTLCFALGLSTLFRNSRLFDPEALGGWARDSEREVGVVTGCLLMTSADLWRAFGGFDPRFFMYGEDQDLSMRAWEAGFRPRITPDAEVVHTIGAASATRANRRVMIMRGKTTLARKHWEPAQAKALVVMLAAGVGLRAGMGTVARRLRGSISAEQEGWIQAWRRRDEWLSGYPPAADAAGSPDGATARVFENSRS